MVRDFIRNLPFSHSLYFKGRDKVEEYCGLGPPGSTAAGKDKESTREESHTVHGNWPEEDLPERNKQLREAVEETGGQEKR
jgi:hypothetical protein